MFVRRTSTESKALTMTDEVFLKIIILAFSERFGRMVNFPKEELYDLFDKKMKEELYRKTEAAKARVLLFFDRTSVCHGGLIQWHGEGKYQTQMLSVDSNKLLDQGPYGNFPVTVAWARERIKEKYP